MNTRYINLLEKRQLYEKARLQLQEWYGAEQADLGSCLYWGQVTMKLLTQAGLRPVLQAGTMQWRMVPPALDDGNALRTFRMSGPQNHLKAGQP